MKFELSFGSKYLWMLANIEAWFCQSPVIEPAHFWIACLKMTDPQLKPISEGGDIAMDQCVEHAQETSRILAYLEMDVETAARQRRAMRSRLLQGNPPRKFPGRGLPPMLHRSESSRRLFVVAARKAAERGEAKLRPMHILESLFEMNLVSLESL